MAVDRNEAIRFLTTAFYPSDWVAVMLKGHSGTRVAQRVLPVSLARTPSILDWLERENGAGQSVYVSVNAIAPMQTSRSRGAVVAIRHLFMDVDHGAAHVMQTIGCRRDLPRPSYVLRSSPDRRHVFWRVHGFGRRSVEALQKRLSGELGCDPAATACSQLTRLPGFANCKYQPAPRVGIEYGDAVRSFVRADFPSAAVREHHPRQETRWDDAAARDDGAVLRAQRYAAAVAPAVAGRHGDVRTFQLCCRLVRGFGLTDADAMSVLAGWNTRCRPPWTERELADKIRRARQYGREPVGGLLQARRPGDAVSS